MKIWANAPLNFQGQKRNWNNNFREIIKQEFDPNDFDIIIDLFGGSGLLAHWCKVTFPDKKVIWNDYDNVLERYKHIDDDNYFLNEIKKIYIENGIDIDNGKKTEKIPNEVKEQVIEMLKQEQQNGRYIDFITLSSFLCFSGNYVNNFEELEKQAFYNKLRKSEISPIGDFLEGIEIVSLDWREVLKQYGGERTLIIADPPYLSTDTNTYKNKSWKLKEYLDINNEIHKQSYGYVFFTSQKSQLLDLINWLYDNFNIDICPNKKIINKKVIINNSKWGNNQYTDFLILSKK